MNSCMNCEDRHPACHDSCERYKSDLEERAELKRKHSEENLYYAYIRRQKNLRAAEQLRYEKRKLESKGHNDY